MSACTPIVIVGAVPPVHFTTGQVTVQLLAVLVNRTTITWPEAWLVKVNVVFAAKVLENALLTLQSMALAEMALVAMN